MKRYKYKIQKRIELFLLLVVAITLFTGFLVSGAGFGSTYIEKVNGTSIINIEIGHNQSYFVYPQNFENKTLLIKINLTDVNRTLLNVLNDVYEIPPNTTSDDFKIEMIFGLVNNTALINQSFPVTYSVLSTFKDENTSAVVSFSPIGYTKTFYIKGIEQLSEQTAVINQTDTTHTNTTQTDTSSSSSSSSLTTKKDTITKIIIPITQIPKTETPINPIQQTPITPLAVVPTSNFFSKIFNIWTGIAFLGILTIIFMIFIAKKIINGRGNNKTYNKYNDYEEEMIIT